MEWAKRTVLGFRVIILILLLCGTRPFPTAHVCEVSLGTGLIGVLVIAAAAACEVRYPALSTGMSKWIGAGGQQGEEYMWPIHLNLGIVGAPACCFLTPRGDARG